MSTNQVRGTSLPEVLGVTPIFFDEHLGAWMLMIRDYFEHSRDKTSSPEEAFKNIRHRLEVDNNFFMVAPTEHGIPIGFLAGDLIQGTARIVMGYMPKNVKGPYRRAAINRSLDLFDEWSKARSATGQVFYTHRDPGAHKFMMDRGWELDTVMYRRRL